MICVLHSVCGDIPYILVKLPGLSFYRVGANGNGNYNGRIITLKFMKWLFFRESEPK